MREIKYDIHRERASERKTDRESNSTTGYEPEREHQITRRESSRTRGKGKEVHRRAQCDSSARNAPRIPCLLRATMCVFLCVCERVCMRQRENPT